MGSRHIAITHRLVPVMVHRIDQGTVSTVTGNLAPPIMRGLLAPPVNNPRIYDIPVYNARNFGILLTHATTYAVELAIFGSKVFRAL